MSSWDDGTHSKVKKVQLTYEDVIYSIQVTYEGSLQSNLRGSVGPKSAEFTLASDEYITALNAYGKTLATQEVITSLTFITNKQTYGPYGNKSGYQISAHEITGKQVAGFLGTSGNVINSIDVHYAPVPTTGSGGSGTGGTGTGGSGTGGSSGTGGTGTGGSGTGGSGTGGSGTGGSGTGGSGTGGSGTGGSGTGGSGTGGSGTGGSGTGGSGTGGSGTGGSGTGGSGTGGSGSGSGVQKLDAQGGTGGTAWDDGSDHDGVTKITVKSGDYGIQYVKFDYVKGGQPKLGATHGVPAGRGLPNEIVINHPEEYLVSVEGWYDSTNVIIGIQFKTNKKTSDYIGYDFTGEGTKFTLQVQDKKIIGFHGFASNNLNSIGAYFVPSSSSGTPSEVPPKKLKAEGGETGAEWDDGAHDNVKKVYVGQGDNGIGAVKFVYANGSEVVYGNEHGKRTPLGYEEFELEADEYITSVEGTYDSIYGVDSAILTRLVFKTNKKTAGPFGLEGSKAFTLKEEGHKIVGFHGRAGPESINAIGAYVAPIGIIPLTPSKPVQIVGVGGDGGTSWDDGAYDGVRKVYVGQADDGIGAVKFVYDRAAQPVTGNEHGKRTMLGYEEFELDYPSEYITAVEGTYDTISASNSAIITMLKFTTNKRTSGPFGLTAGTPFTLKKEGHKIVGFHGNVSDLLHKVGVHVLPITN